MYAQQHCFNEIHYVPGNRSAVKLLLRRTLVLYNFV